MHAAVLHALGKPPRFEEFPDPTPGEGEVLIQVCAAALKPVDKQMAAGTHYASPREFPVVCGMDGVGRLEDGTRVFFGGAPRPFPILVYLPGYRSTTARSWPRAKPC